MLIEYFNKLPDEIKDIIFQKFSHIQLVFLNKTYYLKYCNKIPFIINNYSSYLRDLIRNDCVFIVNNIINYNLNYLIKKINIKYKNLYFYNYLQLIYHYIKNYSAQKCLLLFNSKLSTFKKNGLKIIHIKIIDGVSRFKFYIK